MATRRVTDEQIRQALIASGGVLTHAAQKLGMSRQAISDRTHVNQELLNAREEGRQALLDVAETELFKAVRSAKPWAIRFALGRLGKGRGYGPSLDVAGASLGRVVVYLPDDGREQPTSSGGDGNEGNGDKAPAGPADGSTP